MFSNIADWRSLDLPFLIFRILQQDIFNPGAYFADAQRWLVAVVGRKKSDCGKATGFMIEQNTEATIVGKRCKLLRPVRDRQGRVRFSERPIILREVSNLGRTMFLVQFDDASTTFLFPNELTVE